MDIKICGPGCAKCEQLYKIVSDAAGKTGKEVTLSKVSDFQEIAQMGVFTTPALVIDGQIKCVGQLPAEKDILGWLGG